MVALYIIAGIILFFALLLSLNISVRLIFSSSAKEDMNVFAKVGFYKIQIMPQKPKKEKKIKKVKQKKKKPSKEIKEKEEKPKEKKKFTVPEIFDFVKDTGTVLLKRFKKHFKVRIYKINVILASDEAEKTAMLYGTAIQSAYYLYKFLNYNFKINTKPDSIKIIPDFSKIQTEFDIDIKFYMRLSHILGLLIASGLKFLKFWNKSNKIKNVGRAESSRRVI